LQGRDQNRTPDRESSSIPAGLAASPLDKMAEMQTDSDHVQRDEEAEAAGSDSRSRAVLIVLRRIIRSVDLQSRHVARTVGLTIPQLIVLQAVRDLGEVTSTMLSAHASLSPATVTTILDKLEQRNLVERYRSASDRRVVHTRLTAEGAAALQKAPPLLQESFVRRFDGLDAARQDALLAALGDIADMMGTGDAEDASWFAEGGGDI
jgi:DNA-binding MarR family transcriptional regulator